MAEIQTIDVGAAANAGDGDALRVAMETCNDNFDELDTRTDPPTCYLGFHSVVVPTGSTAHQIVDADLTTDEDTTGLWVHANDRIEVPEGYTSILIVYDGGIPGASSFAFDYGIEVRKNGTTSTGTAAEPDAWSNTQGTSALSGQANDVCSLVIRDVCTSGDFYTFWARQDSGSNQQAVGNIYVELKR